MPGFDLVAAAVGLAAAIATVDLVVTGEGRLDDQSFSGKVVGGVARLATAASVPVLAVVGSSGLPAPTPGVEVAELEQAFGPRSWTDTCGCVSEVVAARLAAGSLPSNRSASRERASL